MKTPITYFGGKQQLSSTIINMIPAHRIYCEPYFGGGAVFFAKPKSYLEVINDNNDILMRFYKTVRDSRSFCRLQKRIQQTLCCESEYRKAIEIYKNPAAHSNVEISWAVWVSINMSFNGSVQGGWKWCNGTAGSHTGIVMNNYRERFTSQLHDRLKHVQISSRDAIEVIRMRDRKETFFYLDPPYVNTDQKHYRGFTETDLEELLMLLSQIEGRFILSHFQNDLISKYIKNNDWNVKTVELPMRVSNFHGNSRKKQEILVYNYTNEPTLFDNIENNQTV